MTSRGSIPGYIFDKEKGRYFPIQPNHIAPKSASYSQSAVTANAQADKLKKNTDQRDHRVKNGRISRSNLRTSFLDLRLGNQLGLSRTNPSTTRLLGAYYASELSSTTAIPHASRELIGFFTLNSSLHVSCYVPEPHDQALATGYCHSTAVNGSRVWQDMDTLMLPKRIATIGPDRFILAGNDDFAIYDTNSLDLHFWYNNMVCYANATDLSISPDYRVCVIPAGPCITYAYIEPSGVIVEQEGDINSHQDYMVTSYADNNILISGERSGSVHLSDARIKAHVHRLQHSSAVNGIHARTQNEIIVSGLESVALYDLRYIKDRPKSYHPLKCSTCRSIPSRKRHASRKTCPARSFVSTQPLVNFHTPADRLSQHYSNAGKSLAYIPSLDMAVIASHRTNSIQAHDSRARISTKADRITLYHASTGHVLPSVFDNMVFDNEILQVGAHRMRDGPESIFVCTEDKLQEFRADSTKHEKQKSTWRLADDRFPADAELGMAEKWEKGNLGPV